MLEQNTDNENIDIIDKFNDVLSSLNQQMIIQTDVLRNMMNHDIEWQQEQQRQTQIDNLKEDQLVENKEENVRNDAFDNIQNGNGGIFSNIQDLGGLIAATAGFLSFSGLIPHLIGFATKFGGIGIAAMAAPLILDPTKSFVTGFLKQTFKELEWEEAMGGPEVSASISEIAGKSLTTGFLVSLFNKKMGIFTGIFTGATNALAEYLGKEDLVIPIGDLKIDLTDPKIATIAGVIFSIVTSQLGKKLMLGKFIIAGGIGSSLYISLSTIGDWLRNIRDDFMEEIREETNKAIERLKREIDSGEVTKETLDESESAVLSRVHEGRTATRRLSMTDSDRESIDEMHDEIGSIRDSLRISIEDAIGKSTSTDETTDSDTLRYREDPEKIIGEVIFPEYSKLLEVMFIKDKTDISRLPLEERDAAIEERANRVEDVLGRMINDIYRVDPNFEQDTTTVIDVLPTGATTLYLPLGGYRELYEALNNRRAEIERLGPSDVPEPKAIIIEDEPITIDPITITPKSADDVTFIIPDREQQVASVLPSIQSNFEILTLDVEELPVVSYITEEEVNNPGIGTGKGENGSPVVIADNSARIGGSPRTTVNNVTNISSIDASGTLYRRSGIFGFG